MRVNRVCTRFGYRFSRESRALALQKLRQAGVTLFRLQSRQLIRD